MWTCKFIQDTAEAGLGTMRAEYVVDGVMVAAHEQRMKNGDESQAGPFIEAAQAKLLKVQEQTAANEQQQALASLLAAKLNG